MSSYQYTYDLASAVIQLWTEGKTDPSCEEIVYAHFQKDLFPETLVWDAQMRLKKIRTVVRKETGELVCLVSQIYYKSNKVRGGSYRDVPPKNDAEARVCVPFGQGIRAYGIRFAKGEDDLIYQVSISHHIQSVTNSMSAGLQRVVDSNKRGFIPDEKAGKIIHVAHLQAFPKGIAKLEKKAP